MSLIVCIWCFLKINWGVAIIHMAHNLWEPSSFRQVYVFDSARFLSFWVNIHTGISGHNSPRDLRLNMSPRPLLQHCLYPSVIQFSLLSHSRSLPEQHWCTAFQSQLDLSWRGGAHYVPGQPALCLQSSGATGDSPCGRSQHPSGFLSLIWWCPSPPLTARVCGRSLWDGAPLVMGQSPKSGEPMSSHWQNLSLDVPSFQTQEGVQSGPQSWWCHWTASFIQAQSL